MDAPNPSARPTLASRTPLRIGAIGLIARDLGLKLWWKPWDAAEALGAVT